MRKIQKWENIVEFNSPTYKVGIILIRYVAQAPIKLQITVHFQATGNRYQNLHLFRVSKPAICKFITGVCEAIYFIVLNRCRYLNFDE